MKTHLVLFVLFANFVVASTPPIWSKTGHRVIGDVAQAHLSRKSKKAITKLLKGQNLASVSNFADEIKADSTYRKFSSWHYANIPADKDYVDTKPYKYGDLVSGIRTCIKTIKDKNSPEADRTFYLKMLVHFIGDLHQPMHLGRLEDKGGNDIQVQWFGDGSNLHRIWDSALINQNGMSYTELAGSLPRLTKQQIKVIQAGDLLEWVEESQEVANAIYDSVEQGEKLYYRYGYTWWPTVETQLQRGGLRLAKVLNDLFN